MGTGTGVAGREATPTGGNRMSTNTKNTNKTDSSLDELLRDVEVLTVGRTTLDAKKLVQRSTFTPALTPDNAPKAPKGWL